VRVGIITHWAFGSRKHFTEEEKYSVLRFGHPDLARSPWFCIVVGGKGRLWIIGSNKPRPVIGTIITQRGKWRRIALWRGEAFSFMLCGNLCSFFGGVVRRLGQEQMHAGYCDRCARSRKPHKKRRRLPRKWKVLGESLGLDAERVLMSLPSAGKVALMFWLRRLLVRGHSVPHLALIRYYIWLLFACMSPYESWVCLSDIYFQRCVFGLRMSGLVLPAQDAYFRRITV